LANFLINDKNNQIKPSSQKKRYFRVGSTVPSGLVDVRHIGMEFSMVSDKPITLIRKYLMKLLFLIHHLKAQTAPKTNII
jgi:acetolactate synthase regulatory subunit